MRNFQIPLSLWCLSSCQFFSLYCEFFIALGKVFPLAPVTFNLKVENFQTLYLFSRDQALKVLSCVSLFPLFFLARFLVSSPSLYVILIGFLHPFLLFYILLS